MQGLNTEGAESNGCLTFHTSFGVFSNKRTSHIHIWSNVVLCTIIGPSLETGILDGFENPDTLRADPHS